MARTGADEDRIVVVGAGPHALTFCTYLLTASPWWLDRLTVVDPKGWLVSWSEQLARLDIGVLRSTGVHHPDPDPYSLFHFAEQDPGQLVGPYKAPASALFDRFCRALVARLGLDGVLARGRVTGVECGPGRAARVVLGDGRALEAEHVVMAHNPLRPRMPSWAVGVPGVGVRHASSVWMGEAEAGQRIAVVGGGLTAAQLAVGAMRRGAQVTLLSRRPIDVRTADADPGWLTGRFLDPFLAESDAFERAGAIRAARRATVPHHWLAELHQARARGVLDTHRAEWIEGLRRRPTGQLELHTPRHLHVVDRIWLGTGWSLDAARDPLLAPLILTGTAAGMPQVDAALRLPGTPVHVMGAAAGLGVGPFAPNLAGARIAAERIVAHLTGTSFGQYPSPPATGAPAPTVTADRHQTWSN